MVVQPCAGMEGAHCCRSTIAEPAEPPRNPTSTPVPINNKMCRTKVLEGYSGLFLFTHQRGCVLHGVKINFSCSEDVGSDPHIKSISSQLLCSQVHLMSCLFADSPVGFMESSWLVSVPSFLLIIHSSRRRQCFPGCVKPRQGACPIWGRGHDTKSHHSVTPVRGQAGDTFHKSSTAQGPDSYPSSHSYCIFIYIVWLYTYCSFILSSSPMHELSSPLQSSQQGMCLASTCHGSWCRWSCLPKIRSQIPLLTQCGVSQETQGENVSTQNLSMAAGLAPGAIIALEGTNEEQFSTAKCRTSLRCQQQLTEGI